MHLTTSVDQTRFNPTSEILAISSKKKKAALRMVQWFVMLRICESDISTLTILAYIVSTCFINLFYHLGSPAIDDSVPELAHHSVTIKLSQRH